MNSYSMEVTTASQESAIDTGMIIAELQQSEKIETVVVTGDFIELGSTYETSEQAATSSGNEEVRVIEVVNVEQDCGAAADNGMEVSKKTRTNPLCVS